MTDTPRPTLYLAGSSDGPTAPPTLDDILKMFTKLTGRQPTEDEIAKAKARIALRDGKR